MLDSLREALTLPKLLTSTTASFAITMLFGSDIPLLIALCTLFLIDTLTGISVAIKEDQFTSSQMKKGVTKFLLYFCSIIVSAQFALVQPLVWLPAILTSFLALVELVSIGENMSKLGFNFLNVGYLKKLLKKEESKNVSQNED